MAVPDWPGTYGENLFLFPMSQWLNGPWDLFIEHGHRLFASLVGLITIAFVAVVFWKDDRNWMKIAALGALLLVIGQGVLGGMRVLLNARFMAMVHGCVGPLFFAYCVALAVATSRFWRVETAVASGQTNALPKFSILTTAIAYLQLVLGAQLRHPQWNADPSSMRTIAIFHVVNAFVLAIHIVALFCMIWFGQFSSTRLTLPSVLLLILIVLQIGLGGATWVVNYGWPDFGDSLNWLPGYVVTAKSSLQTVTVTAHVAVGSLILALGVQIAMRASRLFGASVTLGAAT